MDLGNGEMLQGESMKDLKEHLEQLNRKLDESRVFSVGEKVQVKGSLFRVSKITPKKLVLRLLPS